MMSNSMRPLRRVCSFVLLLAIAAIARDSVPHGQVVQVKVHGSALEHNHIAESPDRDVSIYLPPGYESGTQRYRVVYVLHGYTGTDRGWMNPAYVGLPAMMDRLIERHAIETMIIVMPNCFNRFGGSMYTNSALTGDWEDFIAHDLVKYIDGHYRTVAGVSGRGIAGHSMGGYGALRIGMDHPEVFAAAYGMSPCCSFWDEKEDREDVKRAQRAKTMQEIVQGGMGMQGELALAAAFSPDLQNPPFGVDWPFDTDGNPVPAVVARWKANLLDSITARYAAGKPRLQALAFDVGRQDENHNIVIGTRKLDQQLTKLGLTHEFWEYDGTHNSRIAERMEKFVLPFMSKNLKP